MQRTLYYDYIISESYALITSLRGPLTPSPAIFIVHSRRRHLGRAMWKRTLRIASYRHLFRRTSQRRPFPIPPFALSRGGSRENPLQSRAFLSLASLKTIPSKKVTKFLVAARRRPRTNHDGTSVPAKFSLQFPSRLILLPRKKNTLYVTSDCRSFTLILKAPFRQTVAYEYEYMQVARDFAYGR